MDSADTVRGFLVYIGKIFDFIDQLGHGADRATARADGAPGMRRTPICSDFITQERVPPGDEIIRLAGLGHQHITALAGFRLNQCAAGRAADFFIRNEQKRQRHVEPAARTDHLSQGVLGQIHTAFHIQHTGPVKPVRVAMHR